jgi:cadmium resistance protein CadD (predicted permease)
MIKLILFSLIVYLAASLLVLLILSMFFVRLREKESDQKLKQTENQMIQYPETFSKFKQKQVLRDKK